MSELEPADPDPKREMERFSLDEAVRTGLIKLVCLPLNNPKADWPAPSEIFVVPGEGKDALQSAHAVIVKDAARPGISSQDSLSLVFFSCAAGGRLAIDNVKIADHDIVIRFRYQQLKKQKPGPQYALIPLGKLAPAKYRVRFESGQKYREKWMASAPCDFEIKE